MAKLGQAGTTTVGLDCLHMACPSYGGGIRFAHDFDKEKIMALETKPAKDPAAEDKHELDPKRKAALDTALAQVEKSFGKGSAMRLGDQPEQNVEVIPTGSLALDMALGIGGYPRAASWRSTAPNHPVRPRSHCMWWPMPRRRAAWRLHRCRTRARPGLRPQARRGHRLTHRLPAG